MAIPNTHNSAVPGDRIIEQRWDPERYRRNAAFVSVLGEALIEMLDPQPGERILDLGCGDGRLTELLAQRAVVVAVDASPEQVAAARTRGLDARVKDGRQLDFDEEFDTVFSNAALHWMGDPDVVIDGVWRALKPGGRFIAECGGAGNVGSVVDTLMEVLARRGVDGRAVCPWYFPAPAEYRARLEARGFALVSMALIPRPTPLPGELEEWLDTFAESFLAAVAAKEREAVKREVAQELRGRLCDPRGVWTVDYVRLRFAAMRPAGMVA